MNLYESIKKKLKESAYSDIDPEEISEDAYLRMKKNDDGSVRVDTGIGDHTNLGSGNYTKIPNGEVSRLYDEVISKARARKGSLKFKDNFGRDKATELDKVINAYNDDLDKDVKDLEPYADRPLKRRELDEITEITGRRDASGHSERQMKHRNDGSYGRLQGAISRLKQTSKDIDDESYTKITLEADKKKSNKAKDPIIGKTFKCVNRWYHPNLGERISKNEIIKIVDIDDEDGRYIPDGEDIPELTPEILKADFVEYNGPYYTVNAEGRNSGVHNIARFITKNRAENFVSRRMEWDDRDFIIIDPKGTEYTLDDSGDIHILKN